MPDSHFVAPYIVFSYTLVVQTITISSGRRTENGVSSTLWVFKLFNSIKDEHEVKLAELELHSLFGPVERVRNFYDIIDETPLKLFREDGFRVQDVLTYEPCYGEYQGFIAQTAEPLRTSKLAQRLAYTREFLVVTPGTNAAEIQRKIFPEGKLRHNIGSYAKN